MQALLLRVYRVGPCAVLFSTSYLVYELLALIVVRYNGKPSFARRSAQRARNFVRT